jgi:hypothetical protein
VTPISGGLHAHSFGNWLWDYSLSTIHCWMAPKAGIMQTWWIGCLGFELLMIKGDDHDMYL